MILLTFSEHLRIEAQQRQILGSYLIEAGKPYLFTRRMQSALAKSLAPLPIERISGAGAALRPLVAGRPNQSLVIYNGWGGIGDQMMTWPVTKILAEIGHEVHVLVDPQADFCWVGLPWIRSVLTLPVHWSLMERFDAHLVFDDLPDFHAKPQHPVDTMLAGCGIDPSTIPNEKKVARPVFTPLEREIAARMYHGKRLAFFQLGASQLCRSLPQSRISEMVGAVASAFPELHWIALRGEVDYGKTVFEVDRVLPNVETRSFTNLRILWALLERAAICVSLDSMLAHAAGCFGVPCVGLWGTFPPEARVRYYANHSPIFHRELCSHAPCCSLLETLPSFCPVPDKHGYCQVLTGISTADVVDRVGDLLASSLRIGHLS